MPQENLLPFFEFFAGEAHQKEAVQLLQSSMSQELLKPDAAWIQKYRETPAKPEGGSNPIDCVYDCQLTNPGPDGWRQCFSSACAMAVHYWKPEVAIDDYHRKRPQFGDSTDPSAQIRTIKHFGLDCKYVQVGSVEKLKEQLDLGRPTPVGFLHHGPSPSAPSGGGHWILAVGHTPEHLIAHDPYGELDNVNGGYPLVGGEHGKYVKYSWKYWAPRWSVANEADGWGLGIIKP